VEAKIETLIYTTSIKNTSFKIKNIKYDKWVHHIHNSGKPYLCNTL